MTGPAEPRAATRMRSTWPAWFGVGLALTLLTLALEVRVIALHPALPRPAWARALRLAVVGLPWAVAAFLFVRRVVTGRRTHWLSFSLGAASPWILILGFFFGPDLLERLGRRDFDSAAWKAAAMRPGEGRPSEDRLKMVDDLIASRVLDGRARSDVEALLGPDDSERGTGWGVGYFTNWDAVYWLGTERGFIGIDSEWLVIRYGPDDRVLDYRIVTD